MAQKRVTDWRLLLPYCIRCPPLTRYVARCTIFYVDRAVSPSCAARCVAATAAWGPATIRDAQPSPRAGAGAIPHPAGPYGVVQKHTVMRVARQGALREKRVSINITTSL